MTGNFTVSKNLTQDLNATWFPWPQKITARIAIGLFAYSAFITVSVVLLACYLFRTRTSTKPEVNRYPEHTWPSECVASNTIASRDMGIETISLNSSTVIMANDTTSEHASSFRSCLSNETPRLSVHPDSVAAIPLPSVSEEQTQSTQPGSSKDHHTNSSPQNKTNKVISPSLLDDKSSCGLQSTRY